MPHIHERIDFTADVFIVYQNKVLLRMHDKYHIWLAVGGHIELNEDPSEAAVREVKEEVGIDIKLYGEKPVIKESGSYQEILVPVFMNRHPISPTHEHISLVYFATSNTNEINPAPGEMITTCHWFTKEELESKEYDIKPSITFYALEALKRISHP